VEHPVHQSKAFMGYDDDDDHLGWGGRRRRNIEIAGGVV